MRNDDQCPFCGDATTEPSPAGCPNCWEVRSRMAGFLKAGDNRRWVADQIDHIQLPPARETEIRDLRSAIDALRRLPEPIKESVPVVAANVLQKLCRTAEIVVDQYERLVQINARANAALKNAYDATANVTFPNPRHFPPFNENDCGGAFDGNNVISDADPGL